MHHLTLLDLLTLRGFPPDAKAKIVRHQDTRHDVELYRTGWFETYQKHQARPVFDGCDFVVSCVGAGGTRARFVGVYRVGERMPVSEAPSVSDCPPEILEGAKLYYELEKCPGYEDLEGRIILEWGKAAISWHQRRLDKEIVEILASGDALDAFEDYLEFVITHEELVHLFKHPRANREWRSRLQAVAGVYLILDSKQGNQYIGSAYGEDGIWGRWKSYAANGHGGNTLLRPLVDSGSDYPAAFRYSLLQVLPRTLTKNEVIRWEALYKEKLGSRAFGLNLN